ATAAPIDAANAVILIVIIFSLIDSQSKSFSRQIITVIKPYVLCIF
ncbi:hypothetical protein SEEACDC4_11199, partial [Salmonella enterica subsp. enterica serovar Agona str. SA-4]